MLPSFLENSTKFLVSVLVPNFKHLNMFGTNRNNNVKWRRLDLHRPLEGNHLNWLRTSLGSADGIFYDGGITGLDNLNSFMSLHGIDTSCHALVPGALRLRKLQRFGSFTWRNISHASVGGCSDGRFWLGSTATLRHTSIPPPKYCSSAIKDLVEFAPKGLKLNLASAPVHLDTARPSKIVQLGPSCYDTIGLVPFATLSKAPHIVTTSPYTASGWCSRIMTTKEYGRIFDLPVAIEKRLAKAQTTTLSSNHSLFSTTPGKIIQHSMWLLNFYTATTEGGKVSLLNNLRQPIFSLDNDDTLVRNHDKFMIKETQLEIANKQAVKHDDAEIPVHIWNERLMKTYPVPNNIRGISDAKLNNALSVLRKFALKLWKRRVLASFKSYLKSTWVTEYHLLMAGHAEDKHTKLKNSKEFWKDLEAGLNCLEYTSKCSWWEWKGGSRLLFWRWTPEFKKFARDGIPVFWKDVPKPSQKKVQPKIDDPLIKERMREKVNKVRKRGYVIPGFVKSLIYFFAVPKGVSDIRMVYDGTASGFNDTIWVPNFGLPTCDTLLRGTQPGSWMVDLDIGDMFLNFMLDEMARTFIGIDLSTLFDDEILENQFCLWEIWTRCAMGLKCSPYHAIKAMLFAIEFLKGIPSKKQNPFNFKQAKLNLPGYPDYDPSQSWFSVVNFQDTLSTILATYVDDERVHSSSEENAWEAAHQIATRESYLGIQDAARKRRPPTQMAGAWAGSIIRTNESEVGVVVSEERWNKTRSIISGWYKKLEKNSLAEFDTKTLMSERGFLIYISRTYKSMTTFLKGLHLTIDGWRSDRDEEGWKTATDHIRRKEPGDCKNLSHDYPKSVKAVPRLKNDVRALMEMTKAEKPPVIVINTPKLYIAKYGFGDASGGGFGTTLEEDGKIEVLAGTWNEKGSKKSSNFRELSNFVIRLEVEAAEGKLFGSELFFFTDNDAAQNCYHNGTSSSKLLFDLIVRLKKLELNFGLRLHIIHVSGKRMINQGTDGVSRGNMMEGVLTGRKMLTYIPIHLSAIERSNKLLTWVRTWCGNESLTPLSPTDWLWRGQGLGKSVWTNCDGLQFPVRSKEKVFLWSPPPCVADVAIEYLRESIHKRSDAVHIIIIPKLMTYAWRKTLLKTCDFSFYIDAGHDCWSECMYESLLIGVYLPLLNCFPWTLRKSGSVLELERLLSVLPCTEERSKGTLLRKFLLLTRRLQTLPECVVRQMLRKKRLR